MATLFDILPTISVNVPKIREYRVMYQFGAWVTDCIIYAESDAEAIHDAKESANKLSNWRYGVALFCGNRLVKSYK